MGPSREVIPFLIDAIQKNVFSGSRCASNLTYVFESKQLLSIVIMEGDLHGRLVPPAVLYCIVSPCVLNLRLKSESRSKSERVPLKRRNKNA